MTEALRRAEARAVEAEARANEAERRAEAADMQAKVFEAGMAEAVARLRGEGVKVVTRTFSDLRMWRCADELRCAPVPVTDEARRRIAEACRARAAEFLALAHAVEQDGGCVTYEATRRDADSP